MINRVAVIIVAAGRGTRLSASSNDLPKQYLPLASRPILSHTLDAFLAHPRIDSVLVVRHRDDEALYNDVINQLSSDKKCALLPSICGGATRQASVFNGLAAVKALDAQFVLVHDAARPFVSSETIDAVIDRLEAGQKAVLPAVPVCDTLKRLDPESQVMETVDRTNLWAAQTPQGFDFPTIYEAHARAANLGKFDFTDDTAVAEWAGHSITIADGNADNFKITTAEDLDRARKMIEMADHTTTLENQPTNSSLSGLADIRMGTGYDVHAFDTGDAVILGGISIPHDKKLKGHSDADVVLHAITDAVLGAIGDGDIGAHFPPSDPKWKGAASDQFLIDAIRRVTDLGGRIAHIDATVICEAPKIGPHRDLIRQSIANICGLPLTRVSVKATTSEQLGFTGRREGIAAMAAATVRLPFGDEERI
jgi:2-C-methyl-D-erythritol 4-phosphate cytidylyltransferase / 2-C-methyl-D-erythritol 2,4-cyclodiphosphate synthase